MCLIPKPYQKPHPPLRYACTTRDSFAAMGELGLPIFAGLGGAAVPELARAIAVYREAWRESGHPGDGDVMLRVGLYVAEDKERAFSEPQASTMSYYNRIRQGLLQTAGPLVVSCAPSGPKAWPPSRMSRRSRTAWSMGRRTPSPTVYKSSGMSWGFQASSWSRM